MARSRKGRPQAPIPIPFSESLRVVVVGRGLGATDLAVLTGKSKSTFSRWLRGTRSLSLPTVDAIWLALDLRIVERN